MRGENEFGPDIPDEDLRLEDIPPTDEDHWIDIMHFALTFDGYEQWGRDRCVAMANAALDEYMASQRLPATLTDLRTCLFFEQRRWRWGEEIANPPDMLPYFWGLVEAIRTRIQSGHDSGDEGVLPSEERPAGEGSAI